MSAAGPLGWSLEHHWVSREGMAPSADGAPGRVRIGLTVFAQAHLGEVVALELPAPGSTVRAGEAYGEVETTTTVADLFAPVSGTVAARNTALEGSPELVNADPERDGWIVEVDVQGPQELGALLDAQAYRRATQGSGRRGARRSDDQQD